MSVQKRTLFDSVPIATRFHWVDRRAGLREAVAVSRSDPISYSEFAGRTAARVQALVLRIGNRLSVDLPKHPYC
jgi:hypothetical protein